MLLDEVTVAALVGVHVVDVEVAVGRRHQQTKLLLDPAGARATRSATRRDEFSDSTLDVHHINRDKQTWPHLILFISVIRLVRKFE